MARKKKLPRTERGEGSFRFNASGTLEYRFSYRDENWQAKRKSVTGADEQECYDKAQDFMDKMEKLRKGIDVDVTMLDLLKERYKNDYAMNHVGEPGYARNLNNLVALEKHPIGMIPIKDLDKEDVQDYLNSLTRYSNSVIEKLYRQVRMAFAIALERKIIEENFMLSREMRCPKSIKPDKKVHGLTMDEQKSLIEVLEKKNPPNGRNDYRLQIFIEMYSGMRMGEINALHPEDIDLKNGVIHVRSTISRGFDYRAYVKEGTKTYNGLRDVPISKKLRPYLEEALERKEENPFNLVFYDYINGSVINTNQVNCYFQRICSDAEIPSHGQHSLRHTFATRCIESGIPPVVLKTWLGHKDIHTTLDTYTDVFKKMDQSAVDKFDTYIEQV